MVRKERALINPCHRRRHRCRTDPTDFVVDHTGVIQFTDSGWSLGIRDELERQIHRLLGKARKTRWAKET